MSASQASTRAESLTGEGRILGTLQYMAPEQLEGKDADHRTDIFALGVTLYEMVWQLSEGDLAPVRILEQASSPRVSSDGRWIAYRWGAVFVQPLPNGGRVVQVSPGTATEAVWSRDGRELYYREGARMLAVEIEGSTELRVSSPRLLFEGAYEAGVFGSGGANYDVSPDGRFLMLWRSHADEINLVQNWFDELHERVPIP